MKTAYKFVVTSIIAVLFSGGIAFAQTTSSEPTTSQLQTQIQQLQEQIRSLQAQVDEDQADEGEQTQEDTTTTEEDNQVDAEGAVSDTPAPGTVRVSAQTNTCDLQADTPTCELTIEEVLAYGMSSPTLSVGTTLTVAVAGQSGAELKASDTQFEMTLNSLLPRPSSAEGPAWELKRGGLEPEVETEGGNDSLPEQAAEKARIARQLDIGDRGPDVRKLQELLAANNEIYPEGLVTGYYGSLTAQAVSRLQERAGLPSVGRVGPRTLNQVNSLLNEGAGQSGIIPPGLLQAPGLNGRRGDVSASSSATSSGTTTDMPESGGGEAAKREQPQSRGQGTGPVQDPGGPPKF